MVNPAGGADGIIATQGGRFCGWGLYLLGGKPVFHYNLAGVHRFNIAGTEKLASGEHVIVVDFKYDGGGVGKGAAVTVTVDDKPVAEGRVDRSIPFRMALDETFDIGEDTGTPVSLEYDVPFKFTGKIEKVVVSLGEIKLGAAEHEKLQDMEQKAKLKVE